MHCQSLSLPPSDLETVPTVTSWSRTTFPVATRAETSQATVGCVVGGRYLLEEVLGEGGMSIVMRARHLQLGEPVAIKILRPDPARNEAAVASFRREARALARVRGESVASVRDAGVLDDGTPFLVMELLDGRDLAAELAHRGPLPFDEVRGIFCQLCDAIHRVHRHGIVHRDLKPANVFLARRRDGTRIVKIIDFGIAGGAVTAGEAYPSSAIVGSPAYMAPERFRRPDTADMRSDIWSVGVSLYEALSGRLPFGGGTPASVLLAICTRSPEPLALHDDAVPVMLDAVIARCLDKDPARRYASALELRHALASTPPLTPPCRARIIRCV